MSRHPHFLWSDLVQPQKAANLSLIEALSQNILFCTLSKRELRYLSGIVYERIYQPNETIFRQDDRGFGMYIINKGQIAIQTDASGGPVLLTTLSKGSFFGELALVDPENFRTASAVATEKSVLIGFFKPDLIEILERRPAMGVKILYQLSTVLGRRLLETTEKITLLTNARSQGRLDEDAI